MLGWKCYRYYFCDCVVGTLAYSCQLSSQHTGSTRTAHEFERWVWFNSTLTESPVVRVVASEFCQRLRNIICVLTFGGFVTAFMLVLG